MNAHTPAPILVCLLTGFALLCSSVAIVPPPDGSYPNFNTAEGQNALKNVTTGAGNTAVGWYSFFNATTNSFNTGVGAGALTLTLPIPYVAYLLSVAATSASATEE